MKVLFSTERVPAVAKKTCGTSVEVLRRPAWGGVAPGSDDPEQTQDEENDDQRDDDANDS